MCSSARRKWRKRNAGRQSWRAARCPSRALLLRLQQHLFELVDDHVGEFAVPTCRRSRPRCRSAPRISTARCAPSAFHPHRLVVHAPIEQVAVRLRAAGRVCARLAIHGLSHPPRLAFVGSDGVRHQLDQRTLAGFVECRLVLRIGSAMRGDLRPVSRKAAPLRPGAVELGVEQQGPGNPPHEHLQQAPGAHAVAVFAPRVVQHVGAECRTRSSTRPSPMRMLQVDATYTRARARSASAASCAR